jgi:hypothetical protein
MELENRVVTEAECGAVEANNMALISARLSRAKIGTSEYLNFNLGAPFREGRGSKCTTCSSYTRVKLGSRREDFNELFLLKMSILLNICELI